MRIIPERLIYAFSIQLVVMHIKKNQLMLLYWFILFGFITQSFSKRFGIPYLFLDPEYLGQVNIFSFFIVGIATGVFIMAFNTSSYILNSFRFPFLACLSKTFQKYTVNNFMIPVLFIIVYTIQIFNFQYYEQFKSLTEIGTYLFGFFSGIFIVVTLTLRYFLLTNKDIYKLFGVEHADKMHTPGAIEEEIITSKGKRRRRRKKRSKGDKGWRVETYFVLPVRTRLVRNTEHYKDYMLQSVFKQNHINAAVMELVIFALFMLLGLFREYDFFQIPAAASLLLLFTMFIMLSGVFRFWLKSWATSALIILFFVLNFFSQYEFFNLRTKAYGLDYTQSNKEYNIATIGNAVTPEVIQQDKAETIAILNKWKSEWQKKGIAKPKMVITAISGGGLRSSLFTFKTMQVVDSVLEGELMNHTRLISGSSGGLIGAAYYRGLYLNNKSDLYAADNAKYLDDVSKDLLNTTVFSFIVSDVFLNMQNFKENGNTYYKDRGYAFEKQMNENLRGVLDIPMSSYEQPELNAQIPMMIVSPTIINDGRVLMISPVGISYLLQQPSSTISTLQPIPDGIEFTRFFEEHGPYNTKFSSILRMNSTFPYIMPATALPTVPQIEVMDAGIRDNYGVLNAIRFIYEFKDWIEENTSGVVFLQIRDTNKKNQFTNSSVSTILNKLTSPLRNVSGNFILMQDYLQDDYFRYIESILDCPFDYIQFQLPQMDERITLSWHLTEKEKVFLQDAVYSNENTKALKKMENLLHYKSNAAEIAKSKDVEE